MRIPYQSSRIFEKNRSIDCHDDPYHLHNETTAFPQKLVMLKKISVIASPEKFDKLQKILNYFSLEK